MVGPFIAQLAQNYSRGADADNVGPAERAWGLMPRALYREILERTIEREYVPRFGELGIGVRATSAKLTDLRLPRVASIGGHVSRRDETPSNASCVDSYGIDRTCCGAQVLRTDARIAMERRAFDDAASAA